MNVLFEALLVGALLVPVFWLAETLLPGQSKWAVVFAAGALFHLGAEFSGINKAYIMTKVN